MSRPATAASTRDDAALAWQYLVELVMETRGDWRRKVSAVTGLPFSRVRALYRLEEQPRTLSDLADDLNTDAPAATVMINDLEKRALVQRRPHPADRRAKLVSLTPAGRRIVTAVNRIQDPPPPALAALPAKDLAQLRRIAETLAAGTLAPPSKRK